MTLRYLAMAAALAGATALPGAAPLQAPRKQALESKGWFTSYAAARAEARRTGKPSVNVVVFT